MGKSAGKEAWEYAFVMVLDAGYCGCWFFTLSTQNPGPRTKYLTTIKHTLSLLD